METRPAAASEDVVITGRASSAQLHRTRNLSCHSAVDMLVSDGCIGNGNGAITGTSATTAALDDDDVAAAPDDDDDDEEDDEDDEEEDACSAMTPASEIDPSSSSSSSANPPAMLSGTAYD